MAYGRYIVIQTLKSKCRYSRTSIIRPSIIRPFIIRPSIIRNLDYPAWKFLFNNSENGRVPEGIAAVTMETGLLIFCACAENHVALLFINKVGGSRPGLSIRLSGYPACLWNQDVRIIEVLLYCVPDMHRALQWGYTILAKMCFVATVEPRLSGFWQLSCEMYVSLNAHAHCSCHYGDWMACLSSVHAQTTVWHCCFSIKWVDQGVVYPFSIRHASGTKQRRYDRRGAAQVISLDYSPAKTYDVGGAWAGNYCSIKG